MRSVSHLVAITYHRPMGSGRTKRLADANNPGVLMARFPRSSQSYRAIYCTILYFRYHRSMGNRKDSQQVTRYADMFAAMGAEPRLRIMQLLLTAHPQGLVVGDIQDELGIPASTLSHHLDKLKNEDLVRVRRESTFLWYTANTDSLQQIMNFLYAECCTRNKAIEPSELVSIGRVSSTSNERKTHER